MAILDNRYNKEVMDIILAKYAAGETSMEENEVVSRWMEESEGNRKYMNGLIQILEQIHQSKSTDADEELAWTSLSEKIAGARNNERVIYPYFKWIAAAAVI